MAFVCLTWQAAELSTQGRVYSWLIVVSFVCGLQYMRVVKLLRVFVELIEATITSVRAFTIVLFYILVAVTCTFYFGQQI